MRNLSLHDAHMGSVRKSQGLDLITDFRTEFLSFLARVWFPINLNYFLMEFTWNDLAAAQGDAKKK